MKRLPAFRLVPLALLAVPATAVAAPAAPGGATFSGSCALSGMVRFDPPLTTTARPTTSSATGTGTCSGTLTAPGGGSQALSSAPADYQATEQASSASCNSGVDSGPGTISLGGFTFPFTVDEYRASGAALLHLTGTEGGSAVLDAHISTGADPVAILSECAGAGLAEAPIDGNLQTTSPLVSAEGGHGGRRVHSDSHRDLLTASEGMAPAADPAGAAGLPLTAAASAPASAGGAAALVALAGVAVVARRARRR